MIRKTFLLTLLCAFALAPSIASAEFVLTIDPFSATPADAQDSYDDSSGSGTVFSDSGFTVERTASWTDPDVDFVTSQGFYSYVQGSGTGGGDDKLTLNYQVTGAPSGSSATFKDLYNFQSGGGTMDAFKIGATPWAKLGEYDLEFSGGGGQQTFSGSDPQEFTSDGNFSTVTWTFTFNENAFVGLNNNFDAVPEPTSLILFGSVAGLIFFRRRR